MNRDINSLSKAFWNSASGVSRSLGSLRPATGVTDPFQGVPRYATGVPTSGAISLGNFGSTVYDKYVSAYSESRTTWGVTSGYRYPNGLAENTWAGGVSYKTDGYYRKGSWWDTYYRITCYYAGGTVNQYGQITKNATFQYFRIHIAKASRAYYIANRYDYTSRGYSNTSGLGAGYYNVASSTRQVSIVMKGNS